MKQLKSWAYFLAIILCSSGAFAKDARVHGGVVINEQGTLRLTNSDGQLTPVVGKNPFVIVDAPRMLKSPIRNLRGERVLHLLDDHNFYEIRIPAGSGERRDEFAIDGIRDEEQGVDVKSVFKLLNYKTRDVEKDVACSYYASVPQEIQGVAGAVTEQMGTESRQGVRRAQVKASETTGFYLITISDGTNLIEIKTQEILSKHEEVASFITACGAK